MLPLAAQSTKNCVSPREHPEEKHLLAEWVIRPVLRKTP